MVTKLDKPTMWGQVELHDACVCVRHKKQGVNIVVSVVRLWACAVAGLRVVGEKSRWWCLACGVPLVWRGSERMVSCPTTGTMIFFRLMLWLTVNVTH